MIDRNHPAVEAAARDAYERAWGIEGEPWDEASDLERNVWRADETHALTAALPLLESATEDNLARLRGTPAGKQLLAEGWDRGVADNERGWDHVYSGHDVDPDDPLAVCQTCETPNPYRTEAPGDAPEG